MDLGLSLEEKVKKLMGERNFQIILEYAWQHANAEARYLKMDTHGRVFNELCKRHRTEYIEMWSEDAQKYGKDAELPKLTQ